MSATRDVRGEDGRPLDWDTLLRTCIHCGLCLNDCPTYRLTGDEAESPRGRLVLLREVLAPPPTSPPGELDRGPLDRCLGCLGCQSVCPSGVPYGHLLEHGRDRLGPASGSRAFWVRWLVDAVLSRPRVLAVLATLAGGLRRARVDVWLAEPWRGLLRGLPRRRARWPRRTDADTAGDVAVLAGCAQSVFTPEVLGATLRLVAAVGARPYVPREQKCCGALSRHQGSPARAAELARHFVDTFEEATMVVVPSAGCSAHLMHLDQVLADDPAYAERARALAPRVQDLVTWLEARAHSLDFRPDERRVVYHPPCHHTHAQGIEGRAEAVLARVPGLERVEVARRALCCGSAGSWSLLFPDLANSQRTEKLNDLLDAAPDLVLTANPGCELFLDAGLRERADGVPIEHLAVYLAAQLENRG